MKPIVIINNKTVPQSWDEVLWADFEVWLDKTKEGDGLIPFALGCSLEAIEKWYGVSMQTQLQERLTYLSMRPSPIRVYDIESEPIAKKLMCLNIIRTLSKEGRSLEHSLVYLVAIYQSVCAEKKEVTKLHEILRYQSVQEVYGVGFDLFVQVCENEKLLTDTLAKYTIPPTPEMVGAGIKVLQSDTHDIALISSLAGGDALKMESAKMLPVGEVNKILVLKQRYGKFENDLRKISEAKVKTKNKKR